MPIQPFNPLGMSLLKSPWEQDFVGLLQKGMQIRHEPQRLLRQKEQEELANLLGRERVLQAQAETPYVAQNAQSNAAIQANTAKYAPQLSEAEIKQKELLAKYGGIMPSGETGELLAAHNLNALGHPIGAQALENLNIKSKKRQQDIDLGLMRASSGVGKHAIERASALKKLENPNLTPVQKREAQRDLRSIQLKEWQETADADSLKKYKAGEQIQKTLGMIDFNALSKGAGVGGQKWLAEEALKAPFGKESKEYVNYVTSLKGMEGLAEQVGTFYGTQAATEAQNRLRQMLHDPKILSNPRIAKAEFDYIKKLLHQEHKTFEDSLLYRLEDFQKIDDINAPRNDDLKSKNVLTLAEQQAMAAALRKKQPGGGPSNKPSPTKRFKYINGAWVSA